jgi:hypothetical protein
LTGISRPYSKCLCTFSTSGYWWAWFMGFELRIWINAIIQCIYNCVLEIRKSGPRPTLTGCLRKNHKCSSETKRFDGFKWVTKIFYQLYSKLAFIRCLYNVPVWPTWKKDIRWLSSLSEQEDFVCSLVNYFRHELVAFRNLAGRKLPNMKESQVPDEVRTQSGERKVIWSRRH